ncbi:aftiphilin isoform X1 [Bufo gargarizans]|uniref:aftiphilin isoform X1 n=1 Tax=Bufo gargarizans TaxID=30331 RepID=UPI001CF44935|nr:aftiphilin isoform X1 [Bufo gargarizans]
MEPEIIRMYSSSPPPLDSVADDDDDDGFGEFGGFSDVNSSGIGFANFDTVSYPKTREDFIPSKHFLPIHDFSDNVNDFSSLTSITANENISEIGISKKGPCSVFETNINHDTTQFNVAALDNKGSSGENAKYINSETQLTCNDNDHFISRSQEQIASTCNGEKINSLENLTNGFAVADSDNPQGLQDLDRMGHSKGFKSTSSQSTDLSIDFSPPSPRDAFADFATFSSKDHVDIDEVHLEPSKGSHEGQAQSINLSTESSRFEHGGVSAAMEELKDPFPREEIEEPDTLTLSSVLPPETKSDMTESEISDSMHSLDTKNSRKEEEQTINTIDPPHNESLETSKDVRKIELDSDIESGHDVNVPHEPEFDAFGDVDAALPVTDSVTLDKKHVHEPLELPSNVMEGNENDFGSFEDTTLSFQEDQAVPSEKLSSEDKTSQQWASEEPDEFREFGSFVSLAKKEESSVTQDSDDFADFSTAGSILQPSDWNAFEDDQKGSAASWAAFGDPEIEHSTESDDWQSFRTDIPSSTNEQVVDTQSIDLPAVQEPETMLACEDSTIAFQNPLLSRLERVILACFPPPPVAEIDEKISPLDLLLCTEQQEETSKSRSSASLHTEVLDIWSELQDIHDAYGLKHQWGGSHSNKKLLRSLGIDTRNILFTGNKKQPVIVPMYAAGLGMLEPTKEPLKPLSAAEKIASIAQSSPVPPDESICSSDQLQESLPPVQFDWSSSGLTNPLDASGGSTLLNLDFFGPVDDSGFNSTTTIPGVDPELYALTTAKVECSSASSKATDAFARLMSTAETTSTSARKPRRDENLSEEAAKVIASLPDLSFMHAKVLMFPVSLTPLTSCQDKVD